MKPNIIQEASLSLDTLKPTNTIHHWEFLRYFLRSFFENSSRDSLRQSKPYLLKYPEYKFVRFFVPITRKLIHEAHSRVEEYNERYSDVVYAHRTDYNWAEQVVRLQDRKRTTLLCTEVKGSNINPRGITPHIDSPFYTRGNVIFFLRGTREIAFKNDVFSDSEKNGIKWAESYRIHDDFNNIFVNLFNDKIEESEFFKDFFEDFVQDLIRRREELFRKKEKGEIDHSTFIQTSAFKNEEIDEYSKEHAVSFVRLMKDIMESEKMIDFFVELLKSSGTRLNDEIFVNNYKVIHAIVFVHGGKNLHIKQDVIYNINAAKNANLNPIHLEGSRFKDFRAYTKMISVFNENRIPYTEMQDSMTYYRDNQETISKLIKDL